MTVVHLTSSTFFGGPERQMLGLAGHWREVTTRFLSFREGGRCEAFLNAARAAGFDARALAKDTPRLWAAVRELTGELATADWLFCHGYKANLLGRLAARRVGIPAVAVSRGWTGENAKVRIYEWLDRKHLKHMDRVVAVSDGQAAKVRAAGAARVSVIRNAARFTDVRPDPAERRRLEAMTGRSRIVLAAGRLSPEKGFDVLVEAAQAIDAGFVLFGEGIERPRLEKMIRDRGLQERFTLPGQTDRLDAILPNADVVVLPSFTEGLPNVALEAGAAGVPVVATAVGGTPEAVEDGVTGFLVPPGEPEALAAKIQPLLDDAALRARFAAAGRAKMRREFTFDAQARSYRELFAHSPRRLAA